MERKNREKEQIAMRTNIVIGFLVLLPFAGAAASYIIGRVSERNREIFCTVLTLTELALALSLFLLPDSTSGAAVRGILAGQISFLADGFRKVYALVTALMWAVTTLFAKEYFEEEKEHQNRYWFFVLLTLGATEGVMLSGDLMTSFLFFEILSFTSFTWVVHEQTKEAVEAGYTYLFIAVIGGLILFMGLAMLYHAAGTLSFTGLLASVQALPENERGWIRAAGICILLGFGAKAGMVPVHVWLPKAHPVAPSPASALLSGVLTKVGIYGILMTNLHVLSDDIPFGVIILAAGLVTMFLGALLALFSVNLKRTLACSSMSQIGFILTGTGMMIPLQSSGEEEGAVMAMCGLMLHMVNHSLIKLTLFMAAGTVVMNLHVLTLNEIRGFGRNKTALKIAFALEALGISGVPLMNGYLSKTLLHESIVEGIHVLGHASASWAAALKCAEWIFLFTGGMTFAYMLKLFICIFVEKNADRQRQAAYDKNRTCMNPVSTAAVVGSSLLCPLLGQPAVSKMLACRMSGSDEILKFSAFTLENLKGSAISLTIGALLYLCVVRTLLKKDRGYANYWPAWLDLEMGVYRPLLTKWLPGAFGTVIAVFGENKVLRPVCAGFLSVLGELISWFGENKVLTFLARLVYETAGILGRILDMSLDGLLLLLQHTVFRKRKDPDEKEGPGLVRALTGELSEAARPIVSNFTFALMMTCIGIIVILFVIIYGSVMH